SPRGAGGRGGVMGSDSDSDSDSAPAEAQADAPRLERVMTRRQVRGALAAVVMLVLVPATSCATKQDVTRSELNDSVGPPARLRFETVRSILEDSKGNYW